VLPADTPDKALTNAAWRIKGLRHKAGYSQEDVDYKLQPPTGDYKLQPPTGVAPKKADFAKRTQ